jgi:glycosyltransferase involved in cell wall biosynthesis
VRLVSATFNLARPVARLPHVATATQTPVGERRSLFFPGYIDGVENIAPLLRALAKTPPDWRVEIGACGQRTAEDTERVARELGVEGRLKLLGYIDEKQLREAFERAAVVVRWRRSGWAPMGSPGSAAVSGPLIRAMAHGAAIITNDTRGISECLDDTAALQLAAGDEGAQQLEGALAALVEDPGRREAMATAAREHILREHDPSHLADLLAAE